LTFAFYGNLSFLAGSLLSAALFGHGGLSEQAHPSLAFLFRGWVMPPLRDLALMMSCGLVACAGSLLISQAYRVASPPVVAPLEYTAIVWSATSGWLIWNEVPTSSTLVGISVIVGAGLYVLWTERRLPR
jgi:drug/metabolite transporter (DMT)-like permease